MGETANPTPMRRIVPCSGNRAMTASALSPVLLMVLLLSGCAAAADPPPLSPTHPASPEAATTPLPRTSTTLAPDAEPTRSPGAAAPLYACPMHPEVTSDVPDQRCPKCGMQLVPQTPGHEEP